MLLAALLMAMSFGLGSPGDAPSPVAVAPPHSQLPATAPGLSSDEGFFLVTRGDEGGDVIYFIAQNARHNVLPSDMQLEWQLNPLWPWRVVDRDVVVAFPEAAPIGAARVGLLGAPIVAGWVSYTVRPGDTLNRLSARYGTTVRAIAEANAIRNPDRIYVGQTLELPSLAVAPESANEPVPVDEAGADPVSLPSSNPAATPAQPATVPTVANVVGSLLPTTQPGLSSYEGVFLVTPTDDGRDASYFIAQNQRHSILPGDLQLEQQLNPLRPFWVVDRDVMLAFPEAEPVGAALTGLLNPTLAEDPAPVGIDVPTQPANADGVAAVETWLTYTVRAGDTLSRLSGHNATTIQAIVEANAIRNPNLIYVGQTIGMPRPDP